MRITKFEISSIAAIILVAAILLVYLIIPANAANRQIDLDHLPMPHPHCDNPIDFFIPYGFGFDGATWNDPAILRVNKQYWMYASADHDFNGNIAIYRFVSDDAENWRMNPQNPVFTKNPNPQSWDSLSVETPSVVYFNGQYFLFYMGYRTRESGDYKIGVAVSRDGINFQRITSQPLLQPSGKPTDFFQFIAGEPGVAVFKNRIYLYFTAIGIDPDLKNTVQSIGLVTSRDGKNWDTPRLAVFPDQSLFPRASGWYGYSTPYPYVYRNKMHLFTSVVWNDPWRMVALHHSVSDDGLYNWRQDQKPLLTRESAAWTKREIRSPAIVNVKNDEWLVVFGGDNHPQHGKFGLGRINCVLPSH